MATQTAINKDKKKKLEEMMAGINKKFGAGTIGTVKEKQDELTVKFIKTPSNEVNFMLGGGIAKGKIVELMGENSCGKTSLAMEIIAFNQKKDPNFMAGWFETSEGSFDFDYAKMLGVDVDRLVYVEQPEEGAERGLDAVRAMVASGVLDLVVVNSVAGLTPKKEIEDEIEKANIALQARLMSKLMRVLCGVCNKKGTAMIFINQLRTNVGSLYCDPNVTTGGRALAFYASQRIRMSKHKIQSSDPIKKEDGIKINCKVVKNRFAKGNPYLTTDYYALYGQGIDSVIELPDILERAGIVRKSGSWYYYEDANGKPVVIDGTEMKFNSKTKFVEFLRSSQAARDVLNERLEKADVKGRSLTDDEIKAIEAEDAAIQAEMAEMGEDGNPVDEIM
jgi:recombination protein RecA